MRETWGELVCDMGLWNKGGWEEKMTGTSVLQADWLGTDAETGNAMWGLLGEGDAVPCCTRSPEVGQLHPSSWTYQCQPQMPHNFTILTKCIIYHVMITYILSLLTCGIWIKFWTELSEYWKVKQHVELACYWWWMITRRHEDPLYTVLPLVQSCYWTQDIKTNIVIFSTYLFTSSCESKHTMTLYYC